MAYYSTDAREVELETTGNPPSAAEFFIFRPFFEKFSQIYPWRKDFIILTLSSAPSLLTPSLHCSVPASLAPSSWARIQRGGDMAAKLGAVDLGTELGARVTGGELVF